MPDKLEVDFKSLDTNKRGEPAFNYMKRMVERLPDALKQVATGPALLSGARALATSIRKSSVARVGRTKKRVPPRLRSVVYRMNKKRGKLYKTIKASKGRFNPQLYANVKVGGRGARQAALVEHGHQGAFTSGRRVTHTIGWRRYQWRDAQYDPNARVPGKGFVRAAFLGADAKIVTNFERSIKRTERKVAERAKALAR